MTVSAPPQRRPILTDLDKELLMQLLRQSQTSQESYIRESALGVPWGSLANSLVGGMLAGRERRRQEEKIKRSDAYADKVSEIMNMGTDLVPGQVSISPEGTFVRGDAFKASTEAPLGVPYAPIGPSTYGDTLGNYASSGIAEDQLFEQGIPVEDQLAAQFARDNPDKVLPGDHIVPTNVEGGGVSSWLRDRPATLTVGEEFPEDSTRLGRWYSGARPQEELSTDANVALSQALRGAGYEPFETQQYMEQQRLANLPQREMMEVFDKNNNRVYITKVFNPRTQETAFIDYLTNKPINIANYSSKKFDIGTKKYSIISMDGEETRESLTLTEVANMKDDGYIVEEITKEPDSFESWSMEMVTKHPEKFKLDQSTGNLMNHEGLVAYYHPKNLDKTGSPKLQETLSEDLLQKKLDALPGGADEKTARIEKEFIEKDIFDFKTNETIINLENNMTTDTARLRKLDPDSDMHKALEQSIKNNRTALKNEKTVLKDERETFAAARFAVRNTNNKINRWNRDADKARKLIEKLIREGRSQAYIDQKSKISGTDEYKLGMLLTSITGRVAYAALQDMRNANKTGGGVGQLSEKELLLFQTSAGVLNIGDLNSTLETLNDYVEDLNLAFNYDKDWFKRTYNREWE